ncbi:MAG: ATP-dependent zinc metalloprotease FtsH [bacterium]
MKKHINFSIWYVVVAFAIMTLIQMLFLRSAVERISYSEFLDFLKQGKVQEVVIGPNSIDGILKEEGGKVRPFTTVKMDDPGLIGDLKESGVKFSGKVENPLSRALFSWVLPVLVLFAVWGFVFRRMSQGMGANMLSLGKSKAKLYADDTAKRTTFDDVAGIDEAKEELKEVVEFLKNPQKFQRLGGRIPKGVLLVGLPGTGKTLLAKAVAGEAGVPFFNMSGSDFVEMFVGVGAARVRDLFQQASQKAPCIIFIDELDALGKARGISPIVGGHDEREQTLNQLLTEMDGFDTNRGVIIMGATNRPEILDPALLRPGRFDRQVVIDKPDINGREAILKIHMRGVRLASDVDIRVLAARTSGFVGADLANLVNEAALLAARRNKDSVTMDEFEEAIDRVVAGLEKKKRLMNPKEKEIVAYHESGHAIVNEVLPYTDKVHRISIIPRGIAALGYTLQLPTEDRYLMTESELRDRLCALLGGRVAEEIVFKEVSTGAQNDLQRATEIARSMVKEYGMSPKLGLVTFEPERGAFLPVNVGTTGAPKEYSEQTASEIDAEVKRIIDEAHSRVKEILTEKRGELDKLAKLLLEKEVIEREELETVLGKN